MSTATPASWRIGDQEWRKNHSGKWYVLMWGWWPGNTGTPSWRWVEVSDDKVPAQLRDK